MKTLGVAVSFALLVIVHGYRGYSSSHYNWRPWRPSKPNYFDIYKVLQSLSQLNVSDVSSYYCNYLTGRPTPRHHSWFDWSRSSSRSRSAWNRLTSYSTDKVKSCINYHANNSFSDLSWEGREKFCNLLQSISESLSKECDGRVPRFLEDVCPDFNPTSPTPPPTLPPFPTTQPAAPPTGNRDCGRSLLDSRDRQVINGLLIQLRIVGGTDSEYGKYPFIVTVRSNTNFCGGTIIDTTHIMTAAHCVEATTPDRVTVGVGEFDRSSDADQTDFGVQVITVHPQFDGRNINDIALLQLSREIDYVATNSGPVCLPSINESVKLNGTQNCVVAGWGLQSVSTGLLPNLLQEVTIPAYDGIRCESEFNFLPSDPPTQLCAGLPEGGIDSCQGDSGGPLICLEGGQWVQYGIVSYGALCAAPGQPGIYTDVSQYVNTFI